MKNQTEKKHRALLAAIEKCRRDATTLKTQCMTTATSMVSVLNHLRDLEQFVKTEVTQ